MNRDIKSEILAAAREMFREQGFDHVSMRNVADKLKISVGNLTYHFRKKEDLIEAVIAEMRRQTPHPARPTTLEELNSFFQHITQTCSKNCYYLLHFAHLSGLRRRIYNLQKGIFQSTYTLLQESFRTMQQKGLLGPEALTDQITQLTQVIMIVGVYWTPQQFLTQDSEFDQTPLQLIWNITYPLLTDEGKKIYQEEIAPHL